MITHKVRPLLIDSKESTLHLSHGKLLITSIESTGKSDLYKSIPQELILISLEDEKIEVGNEFYSSKYETIDVLASNGVIDEFTSFKVIARQSQIPPEYISKFIEQYNNGCVEDLEIEMGIRSNAALGYKEYVYLEHICDKKYVPIKIDANINQNSYSLGEIEEFEDWEIEIYTKLTNGFVTIVEKEYSHNLLSNMQYYMEYCQANGYVTPQDWLNKFKHYSDRKEPISYTEGEVLNLLHKLELDKNINLAAWFNKNKKK